MQETLTFDDVLLEPQYSEVLPVEVNVGTTLSPTFPLAMPILSSAMDTVTESKMAIAMAQSGGLGVIHKNCSAQVQAAELEKVKRFESGVVYDPVTVGADMVVAEAEAIKAQYGFSGLPVIDKDGVVVGIVTNRDLRFETDQNRPLRQIMTPADKLITVRSGFDLQEVKGLMHRHRIERVIVTDEVGRLDGLVTVKDILKDELFPNASKDGRGRLRVGAAVGVDDNERAGMLVDAGADVLVVDSAHGHSKRVLTSVAALKKYFPTVLLIAGNTATAAGARALVEAGADVIKVGIGPGSICTTRMVTGVGVPQIAAISNVAQSFAGERAPAIIADGGLRYSGDIAKAIAAGANAVMVGGMLAGTEETPGETELYQGRTYKRYRGMGSLSAMRRGSSERYFQRSGAKLVPEGVEGRVPYKGKVADVLHQLVGGLRAAMGYIGAADIASMREKAVFVRVTNAGIRESHVHSVEITRESPNYQVE